MLCFPAVSGLVRARGLKLNEMLLVMLDEVRARKSPWIETDIDSSKDAATVSGLVRARGLKR